MNYDATFTGAHALILAGIIGLCLIALVCIVAMARWLIRIGEARIGMAELDACRPSSADVAAREHELFAFDLGRTRSRTLAEKLSIARNEIAA